MTAPLFGCGLILPESSPHMQELRARELREQGLGYTDAEWAAWREAERERIRTEGDRVRQELFYGYLPGMVAANLLVGLLTISFFKFLDERGY